MKFRFALLIAALTLVLSVNALANGGEASITPAAPTETETEAGSGSTAPFAPLRSYDARFADVKSGDWFAPAVIPPTNTVFLTGAGRRPSRPAAA